MNTIVQIALFGWPVLAVVIFAFLPPRRAVLVALLGGCLFLPVAGIEIPSIRYDRSVACSVGALLGVLLFDFRRLTLIRPSWMELPIVTFCLCPIASSMTNGLGFVDGAHEAWHRIFEFFIPYLLGRLYFHSPKGLRELAFGLFIGGLVYMPLCLLEIRLSPQLHTWVYGYHQHEWGQTIRFGGWRPVVFMTHGLELGMWMACASLSGLWLWVSGNVQRVLSISVGWLVVPLLITTVLCKSLGSLVLLCCGIAALVMTRWPRTRAFLIILVLTPLFYIGGRSSGWWSGDPIVSLARNFGEDKADSVGYRFLAEDLLSHHALRQPLFGWGAWGRNRPAKFNELEPNLNVDGYWIIILGTNGFTGILGILGTYLLPAIILVCRLRAPLWSHRWCAPAAIFAVVLTLFMIDCLLNAMLNQFYLVAAGALGRAVLATARRKAAGPAAPRIHEVHLQTS